MKVSNQLVWRRVLSTALSICLILQYPVQLLASQPKDLKKYFEGWESGELVENIENRDGRTVYVFYGKRCRANTCETKRIVQRSGPPEPVVRHSELYIPDSEGTIIARSDDLLYYSEQTETTSTGERKIESATPVDLQVSIKTPSSENSLFDPKEKHLVISSDSDWGQLISDNLPEITMHVTDGIKNYGRMRDMSKKMHHAYKASLKNSSNFIQAMKDYKQRKKDASAFNSGINKITMGLLAQYLKSKAKNHQQNQNASSVRRRLNDQFAYREYDYTDKALENIESEVSSALKGKNYNKLSALAEQLSYQKDENKREYAKKILDQFTNDQGIIQISKIDQRLNQGPFESTQFKVAANSPERQLLQRVANQYQATWGSTQELESLNQSEKEAFAVGAILLSASDLHFINSDKSTAESILRASKSMLDAAKGFSEGVGEAVTELAKSIPALVGMGKNITTAFANDPAKFASQAYDIITNVDAIADGLSLAIMAVEKDLDTIAGGSTYERSKLIGRYATEITLSMATGGIIKGVQIAAKSGKIVTTISKVSSAFSKVIDKSTSAVTMATRGKKLSNFALKNLAKQNKITLLNKAVLTPQAAIRTVRSLKNLKRLDLKLPTHGSHYMERYTVNFGEKISPRDIASISKSYKKLDKNLTTVPRRSFDGEVWRAVREDIDRPGRIIRNSDGDVFDWHPGTKSGNHRYSQPGERAQYTAIGKEVDAWDTVMDELGNTANLPLRLEKSKFTSDRVLDLSQPDIRKLVGVKESDLIQIDLESNYQLTQQLGAVAREHGFDSIIAPSARRSDGLNLIILGD